MTDVELKMGSIKTAMDACGLEILCHTGHMDAQLTLQKFALRARRIAAHTLAADRERLSAMANTRLAVNFNLSGHVDVRRELPDEESFESLVARLRPVLVKRESIHYGKVMDALESILKEDVDYCDDVDPVRSEVERLCVAWSFHNETTPSLLRYAIQRATKDGTESTPVASDSQLALAWLYGDLVHADVKGKKLDGTLFPIEERYAAAVSYFSAVAILCAQTFDVIMELTSRKMLSLGEAVMDTPVVVGSTELVKTSLIYCAPFGTKMPRATGSLGAAPEGFEQLTVTRFLRMDPKNQVQVRMADEEGGLIAEYEAAVRDRRTEGERRLWRVIIANCVIFEAEFVFAGENLVLSDFRELEIKPTTNRMNLDRRLFKRDLYQSYSMRFIVDGRDFFEVCPSAPSDDDIRDNAVIVEAMADLLEIERISGQEIAFADGEIDDLTRAELRRCRLLWEGRVVPYARGPLVAKTPASTMPEFLAVQSGARGFAGAKYPTPELRVRHPRMVAEGVELVRDSEPPQYSMRIVAPDGEPFVAWAPGRAEVDSDADLLHPTPWGMSYFDTARALGSQWTEGQRLTM